MFIVAALGPADVVSFKVPDSPEGGCLEQADTSPEADLALWERFIAGVRTAK